MLLLLRSVAETWQLDNYSSGALKGQCHEIFCFWFFSWISFPQAPEYTIRAVSNFFRKFAEIFSDHGWPPAANFATSFTSVADTGGKFATGVNDAGGKFAAGVNNTGGKLPPVSTTPVANNGNNIRLQIPQSELEGKNLYIC